MFTQKGNLFNVVVLALLIGALFSGCPKGAPLNSTKLEIGGEMVSDVLGAWKEKWYKFEIDADNTPFLLIFKNLDAADESWLGYQINWYYENDRKLDLIDTVEVEPTGPANPDGVIIFEDKERIHYVAPYKGTYYIRLYGYAQPTSENKKYELRYVIGLAKPETYTDATNIEVGTSQEVTVNADILSVYKLAVTQGNVFQLKIEDTLSTDIVDLEKPITYLKLSLIRMSKHGYTSTILTEENFTKFVYNLPIHSADTNSYYLVLETREGIEFKTVRANISLIQIPVETIPPGETAKDVLISGKELKALKLQVEQEKKYSISLENYGGVNVSIVKINSNSVMTDILSHTDIFPNIFTVPKGNMDEYYIILEGTSLDTNTTVKITFNTILDTILGTIKK